MPDTTPQVLAVMALMREIEKPSACYNRAVRRAAHTLTDSPENDAAQARGNAALLEVEQAVRAWVAEHPKPPARLVLGTTDQQPETEPDADLRDRIAQAARDLGHPQWDAAAFADAVLAVLPVPVDRAAALREAAEVAVRGARACGDSETGQYAASVAAGIGRELRRLADEAQQPETEAAYPTTTTWTVEAREPNGTWTEWGDHYTSDKAHQLAAEVRRTAPNRGIRVVRQVVTYTVEPAADQPDTETEAAK
ncbi:hypothetical protein OG244_28280 [Streptomyces brevispora]|uniref:hypothetical protein n=1 Tax=Streptomyces brevispora TaxID=887462 RepID=UPI002E337127|nr:hypothetical protein [Streptomyces brevispora]